MLNRIKRAVANRRVGGAAVTTVALSFFLMGLIAASDLNWMGEAQAENTGAKTPNATAPRATPDSFANLAQQLTPTVVNIKVTKMAKTGDFTAPQEFEDPYREFFERFFEQAPRPPESFRQQGSGSGVIVSQDGYIVTNQHVIEGADEVMVTLADQTELKAEVMGRDPKTDLAVLKIETQKKLPVATLGDSQAIRVGDWVMAIGNPFGLTHTVTTGIVSAKGRVIGAGPYDDFIQTDAAINPGNSGGPLFDMQGNVVGINTAINPAGQGIGFAIPAHVAKPLIPQLIAKGEVTRGYLGVSIQAITPDLSQALNLDGTKGALVAEVRTGTAAAEAGIKRGDVIVSYNDKVIDNVHDLPAMVANTPVGDKATVTILRGGQSQEIELTIDKLPTEVAEAGEPIQAEQSQWGLQLQDLTPEMAEQHNLDTDKGVVVAGVQPDSPAAEVGLREGDIILEVNRQPVTTVQDAKDVLSKSDAKEALLLLVKRGEGSLFVAMAK
jgi:serine protease Do